MDIKPDESYKTFEDLKVRLDEIVEAVSDDDLPLDEALDLYEEAVSLGLRASDLLEEGIEARRAAEAEASAAVVSEGTPGDSEPVSNSNTTVSIPSAPAAAGSAGPASAEDASASADDAAVAHGDAPGN